MNAETRRRKIVEHLSRSAAPVSATVLAGIFSVSRQVIVGDIALLRASGEEITATPRGYVLVHSHTDMTRTVAVKHSEERTAEELYIFVDNGCIVEDVIVEHQVYGQLIGQLQLTSRYDVGQFMDKLEQGRASVLSSLTEGIHLHTIRCPDEAAFDRTCLALKKAGILLEQED